MAGDRTAPTMQGSARRRFSAGTLVLALIAAQPAITAVPVAASSAAERVALTQPPKAIDDFALTDQEGKVFRFSQLRGGPALVFFGFTSCPDVCPSTLAKLALLTNSADQRVRGTALVMISIDGARDTPAVMKAYLAQVSPRCLGLTGDPLAVRRIGAQFSAVFFKGLPATPGGPYTVQHTSQIYLVDGQGRLRASFFDASVDAMARTTAAIADEPQGHVTAAP